MIRTFDVDVSTGMKASASQTAEHAGAWVRLWLLSGGNIQVLGFTV